MKPPTPEAVEDALAILIESLNEQNGTRFASRLSEQRLDQTLAQLEQNDLALQAANESISIGVKTWLASLKKSRNAFFPMGRIPVELTVEILLGSLRVKDRSSPKRLQQLASVSTHWWDLIVSFPRFWTTINLTSDAMLKIRRSGNRPLTIALHRQVFRQRGDPTAEMILNHLHRCKNLQLSGDAEKSFSYYLWGASMPLLETVDYKGHDIEAPAYLKLPPNNIVHTVRLSAAIVSWSTLVGLKNHHISHIDCSPPITFVVDVAEALRSCPLLEVLELKDLYGQLGFDELESSDDDESSVEGEGGGNRIELPKLRRLILKRIEPGGSPAVLANIHAKFLTDFQLIGDVRYDRGTCNTECQSLVGSVIKNGSINQLVVLLTTAYLDMRSISLEVGQGRLRLHHMDRSPVNLRGLMESVPRSVRVDLRISISISLSRSARQWDMINTILDHSHGIESLSLTMHPKMINRVVEKLSMPHSPAEQKTLGVLWPAQRLSRLRVTTSPEMGLDFEVIEAGLANLLKSRAQATDIKLPELKVSDHAGFTLTMVDGRVEWMRRVSPS